MLEGLAAWLLKTYIGKYVHLNADKLSVGLLSGSVELENLPIIKDAFNDYELPFEVKFGHIGKIKLNISLNKLRNTPWSLLAEGLYLIIGPKKEKKEESEETIPTTATTTPEQQHVDQEKIDKLNNLDNRWFKEIELLNENKTPKQSTNNIEQTKWFSFGSVAYNIVKNLQVDVNNLHIRYEDDLNNYCIGAHITSISIKNGDDSTSDKSSKLCELNEFKLYADLNLIYLDTLNHDPSDLIKLFNLKIAKLNELVQLIILPTSFKAQIIRNLQSEPLRSSTKPRIKIKLLIDELNIKLNLKQIKYLFELLNYINLYTTKLQCRADRPRVSITKETARIWWQYAINCVKKIQPKKLTLNNFISWSKDVNVYKRIYFSIYMKTRITNDLNQQQSPPTVQIVTNVGANATDDYLLTNNILTLELLNEKKRIENEWNYKRLRLLRRTVFESFINSAQYKEYLVNLKSSNELKLKTLAAGSGTTSNENSGVYNYIWWRFSNMWSYDTASVTKQEQEKALAAASAETAPTIEIDNEVRELINDSIEDESLLRRDTILINLEFNLKLANIRLYSTKPVIADSFDEQETVKNGEEKEFLEFKLDNSKFIFEARPRHESYLFELNLDSIYLLNKYDLKTKFQNLIYPKNKQQQCFQFKYETRPLQQVQQNKFKSNLLIKSTSLNIIYNHDYILKLNEFMSDFSLYYKEIASNKLILPQINADLFNDADTSSILLSQMSKINDKVQVNKLINYNKYINNILFDIEINAPNVLFPQNIYDDNGFIIIIDFGRLTFLNKQQADQQQQQNGTNNSGIQASGSMNKLKQSASSPAFLISNDDEDGDDDDDDDDEFLTPVGTPPDLESCSSDEAIAIKKDIQIESHVNAHEKLYYKYELNLNDLQIVCGRLNTNNLNYYLNKGHSNNLHLIEKFDVTIAIDICKFKSIGFDDDDSDVKEIDFNKLKLNKLPFIKINGQLNLLKVHIDYVKLINAYETVLNIQKLLNLIKKPHVTSQIVNNKKQVSSSSSGSGSVKNSTKTVIYVLINLCLNELNLTMSGAKAAIPIDNEVNDDSNNRHSIAELRICQINSEIIKTNSINSSIKFSIYSLLLIDALQIYGNDYQLLAASHLDGDEVIDKKSLINFQMNIVYNKALNLVENYIDVSFSTLDLILNPETISELIILFYSSYLHIKNLTSKDTAVVSSTESTATVSTTATVSNIQQHSSSSSSHQSNKPGYVVNVNFNFNQLSLLVFRIDEYRLRAEKIALFILEGTFINMNINSNKKLLYINSKLNNLTVKDLDALEDNYVYKHVFGIGLEHEQSSENEIIQVIYKSDEATAPNLEIKMASIYYLHSPKLIFNLKYCLNDFKRFHSKIIDNISEKLANLAMRIYLKGKTLLQNTLADMYEEPVTSASSSSSTTTIKTEKAATTTAVERNININVLVKTPIIIIPMKLNSTKMLIAHLGHIHINNNLQNMSNFMINLKKMTLFSIDLNTEHGNLSELNKIANLFQIYSKPKIYLKLINDTDLSININSIKKADSVDLLAIDIKLENESVIKICKLQFEQLIKTLDNIFYDENEVSVATAADEVSMNQTSNDFAAMSMPLSTSIMSLSSTAASSSSVHNVFYSAFSNFKSELNTNIEVKFAIKKLYIQFLADIIDESNSLQMDNGTNSDGQKQIAELCFNNFELLLRKSEQYMTYVDMKLKSIHIIDKLNNSNNNDNCKYLLISVNDENGSGASKRGTDIPRSNKTKYVSHSLPTHTGIIKKSAPVAVAIVAPPPPISKSTITFNKLEDFLDNSLSTSLPAAQHSTRAATASSGDEYPTTPPPSPFLNKLNFSKYESFGNLKEVEDAGYRINDSEESKADDDNLLVSIKVVLVDSRHKYFEKQYLSINKFIKIKFSNLQLNINPETWIFILDLVGIGSKVYSPETADNSESPARPILNKSTSSIMDTANNEPEKTTNTSIEFEVKHFAILLNKNQQPMTKFNIRNINLFIESKPVSLKLNGKLGFLSIDDVSEYKGLYKDRFLTSGKEALIFELYKHQSPDPKLTRNYDISLKLRMSSVKYVHIQRFIVHLTNYFQQFNQLQDALGRMRAISLGKYVEYTVQRSARILLDIQAESPIIIIPHHFKSNDALVFNLGNIKIENKFLLAGDRGTLNYEKMHKYSSNNNNTGHDDNEDGDDADDDDAGVTIESETRSCLLDVITVQFTETGVYSVIRHDITKNSESDNDDDDDDESGIFQSYQRRNQVRFKTFLFKKYLNDILPKPSSLYIHIERNLENELSHSSPDWSIHAQLTSVDFCLDLKQYTLIKGLLEHNIGENISETVRSTFLLPNTGIETVLTGQVWKVISINFDLENVGIELFDCEMNSLAYLAFIKSELIYESNSDRSKLIDLVSTEIILNDTRPRSANTFSKILYNPNNCMQTQAQQKKRKSLQLEIHYRSNKNSNRYSILFNSCRVIVIFDWLIQVKTFLLTNPIAPDVVIDVKPVEVTTVETSNNNSNNKIEVKLNLTNTDFVIIENLSESSSQALILRMTAFIEYNKERKFFHSCLQSVELFSCYMNSIENTALSIMDPVTFTINTKLVDTTSVLDTFLLEVMTDCLKLRFSYLDFNLFLTLIESTKKQFQISQQQQQQKLVSNNNESDTAKKLFSTNLDFDESMLFNESDRTETSIIDVPPVSTGAGGTRIKTVLLNMNRFCLCIIDDCKDVDVPLVDIQFNLFKLTHNLADTRLLNIEQMVSHGNAEFSLNIDYYNRLLSGWEPLIETWVAQLNWKFKHDKNSFTLTSMGTLNVNLTNAFIDLVSIVYKNWKDDFDKSGFNTNSLISMQKRHKIFQPYKLVNLTGSNLKFSIFEDTSVYDKELEDNLDYSWSNKGLKSNDLKQAAVNDKWMSVEKNSEKDFNFFDKKHILNKKRHLTSFDNKNEAMFLYSSTVQHKKLVKHRIRIKLDDTLNEIEPITIDKVGTYYRDVKYNKVLTRLIFDVSLSGNSTKLIKIKSPITVKNKLKLNIECKIESLNEQSLKKIYQINAGADWSIPIKYLPCKLWFRPSGHDYQFSTASVHYINIQRSGQVEYNQHCCDTAGSSSVELSPTSNEIDLNRFYFFVKIKRLNFQDSNKNSTQSIPGHMIYLEPSVTLYNLLPIEFRYIVTKSLFTQISTNLGRRQLNLSRKSQTINEDKVDSYKCVYFHNIDATSSFDLKIDLETIHMVKPLDIHPSKLISSLSGTSSTATAPSTSTDVDMASSSPTSQASSSSLTTNEFGTFKMHLQFKDDNDRPLHLISRIVIKRGNSQTSDNNACPIQIYISAPYCFFNLTGLPLIYKQAFCKEAAGQQEEHEIARSNQAFLFSFNDNDSPYACSMRIGKHCNDFKNYMLKMQQQQTRDFNTDAYQIVPKWCKPFSVESGSSFRALHVINNTVNSSSQHHDTASGAATASSSSITADSQYLNPDWVYYIGIEVKKGRGIFKDTNFVYFSTRYYLVNKTSKDLLLSQYYAIEHEREENAYLWHHDSNLDHHHHNKQHQRSHQQMVAATHQQHDEIEKLNCLVLLKDSMIQFHWPRTDRDQLLSIKLKNDFSYNWSGGFKIDEIDTFYLNLRHKYNSSEYLFLRIEIVLEGGTFFIMISDYANLPPPIRIDNQSEVEIYFYQNETKEENYCSYVKPKKYLNYTWDELSLDKKLIVGTRGGTSEIFDFNNQEEKKDVYYENFIYIVFKNDLKENQFSQDKQKNMLASAAHNRSYLSTTKFSSASSLIDSNELVLTVVNRNKVTIKRKECGNRSQLWRMTAEGLLVHEGTSPPNEFDFNAALNLTNRYVLDIADIAPRPNHKLDLTLSRPDQRRNNTQKWVFTEDGYLCCKMIKNMCLQIDGEFDENARVVLGPMALATLLDSPSYLMKVSRQRLKPGSGHLKCEMFNDGPTRVLRVVNVNQMIYQQVQKFLDSFNTNKESESGNSTGTGAAGGNSSSKTNEVYIHLSGGIGISLIMWLNQEYEELIYSYFKMIALNFEQTASERKIDLKIDSIQACNQLLNSQRQNLIYIQMPLNSVIDAASGQQQQTQIDSRNLADFDNRILTPLPLKKQAPALSVSLLQKFNYENLVLIKELTVDLADVNLQIEEKLLWKLMQFIGFNREHIKRANLLKHEESSQSMQLQQQDDIVENNQYLNIQESILSLLNTNDNSFKICPNLTNNYYKNIIDTLVLNSKSTKYCLNEFKIDTIKMNLSVYKTSKLSSDLIKIKSSLGIPLIQFENARIELNSFILINEYDTSTAIFNIITKHYAQELKSHAMRILGSVDFLGNPLGLYADFLDSFSSVLSNGDFTELIFNLTHGVANSASKFTGSLSNELTELSMDEKHQETRETIRNNFNNGSVDHFIGGALGFAVGVYGGLTSMFSQTYRGFSENGLSGAFIGLGKGAIGTVSKPVVGILDLANGVATAIRDTSKTIDKMEIPRIRDTRCCSTPGALLTSFLSTDAEGQKILYQVNNFCLNEKYMALEHLDDLNEILIGLVTSDRVLFVIKSSSSFEFNIIYQATYQELKGMNVIEENNKTYVEIYLENPTSGETKSPRFRCKNRIVFNSFSNKVRFAKANYDETKYAIVYDFDE